MAEPILVLGAGFLGRTVAARMADDGARVLLAGRRVSGLARDGIETLEWEADLESNPSTGLARLAALRPTIAVLAFGAGRGAGTRDSMLANAVYPAEVTAWLARHGGCATFVQLGSCFEYGGGERLAETDALRPFNVYGASKVAAGLALQALAAECDVQVLHLRLFTVFGPGEAEERLLPSVFRAALDREPLALSDGRQARDWIYAADVADFVAGAIGARPRLGRYEVLNVCSGQPVTVGDVARRALAMLETRFGLAPATVTFQAPRKWEGEPDAVVGDPARTKARTGWLPRWHLEEAMADYFEQYRSAKGKEVGAR